MPKISALPTLPTVLGGTEEFPLVQSGVTYKALPNDVVDYITSINNTWTKSQRGVYQALTSTSASVAIDLSLSNNFNHTLTEDTTLAAPTNAVAGQAGVIEFIQGSGPYTLGFDTFWLWAGGACPDISEDDGSVSVMSYVVASDASAAYCVWLDGFAPCSIPD